MKFHVIAKSKLINVIEWLAGSCNQICHGGTIIPVGRRPPVKGHGERGEGEVVDEEFCLAGTGTLRMF